MRTLQACGEALVRKGIKVLLELSAVKVSLTQRLSILAEHLNQLGFKYDAQTLPRHPSAFPRQQVIYPKSAIPRPSPRKKPKASLHRLPP